MDNEPDDKKDLTPEELAALRPKEKPTATEKEIFEGEIKRLREENDALKKEIVELRETYDFTPKNKPEKKKKGILSDFSPL